MELMTGWLATDGNFYPCGVYEHISCAQEILKDANANTADETLLDAGYVQITISQLGVKSWRFYWRHFLTEYQKAFLRPYFDDPSLPVGFITRQRWDREEDS